jgi:hypothetical protein
MCYEEIFDRAGLILLALIVGFAGLIVPVIGFTSF